ncbi:uncharacterized protein [Anoplolepis gracilipes]
MTYMIKTDPHEPVGTMTLISKLKCRPKAVDNLFCHLQNSTIVNLGRDRNTTREVETEQIFEIKFNERGGVEGLIIEPPSRMEVVNVLRKIANQFSIGVDRHKIERMSQFMARENSSMGNCATVYRITRGELKTNTVKEENIDFQLNVLPMTNDTKPISNLSIEKSRMGCINPPRYVDFSSGILKMGRFVSKIQINNRFTVFTEFDGKVRPPTDSMNRILLFKEIVQLNLDSINPAQGELPPISYGELIDLNINTDIPSNFIN